MGGSAGGRKLSIKKPTRMATSEEKELELIRQFKQYMSNPENVNIAANNVFERLVDDIILGEVFSVHYSVKSGLFELEEEAKEENDFQIDESADADIFGQQPVKKAQECICFCPTCKHSLAASRFAPHLAKCMGMGRNSSRIASRRIANNSKEVAYSGMMTDDEDDADWTSSSDRRRKKKEKNGARRTKNQKNVRNGDVATETVNTTEVSATNMNYDGMAYDEKKNLLTQICGVISEHTRRLCTRSMRCPQHSDEQRRAVRASLLNPTQPSDNSGSGNDIIQVDVDTYEEGDGQTMRESLGKNWEQEHSNTSSPADSASTSSSSSKKKEKTPKSKSKTSSKNHKSGPAFPPSGHHQQGD